MVNDMVGTCHMDGTVREARARKQSRSTGSVDACRPSCTRMRQTKAGVGGLLYLIEHGPQPGSLEMRDEIERGGAHRQMREEERVCGERKC